MQGDSRLLPSWGVVLALAFVAAFSAAPAIAKLPRAYQVTRVDSPNPSTGDRLGDSIVNAGGDIDGDGPDDLVVGIGRGAIKGKVLVLNGVDGSVIREIPAPSDDVDGDGTEREPGTGDPDAPTGFGATIASIADMGSCPDGTPGLECDTAIVPIEEQDTGDGVPEILVGAVGLDIAAESDDQGAVFVIDGGTGAILKRLRTPDGEATTDVGFGRSVLSPGGESACAGTGRGGISDCVYQNIATMQNGDLNDGGKPDIVVGAPDYNEISATTPATPEMNPACSDGAGGGACSGSGRVYVFYGEALVGVHPTDYPASASITIKNPFAQHDDPAIDERYWAENMGQSLTPVGDLGSCTAPGAPGSLCPERNTRADGRPEFTVSVPLADAGTIPDAGQVFVVDGATGVVLDTYGHPEPQAEALFGFSNHNIPALGDVGGSDTLPDLYVPAIGQSRQLLAQGHGYVFNGTNTGSHLISTLADPTPAKFGNFGTAAVGIGDVASAEVGLGPLKEILVGTFGTQETSTGGINDVHIFSPITDQVLQTVPDPDQQPGSGFGRGLAPLGDTNGDGSLDFAVGAGGFDTSGLLNHRGRIYIFTSDDSPPAPSTTPKSQPPGNPPPGQTLPALAGRTIELEASRTRITRGTQITLRGVVEAFVNRVRCERNQPVEIQRRRRGSIRYRTLPTRLVPSSLRTRSTGAFSVKIRPDATYYYRARLPQSSSCLGAISPREQVIVRRKATRVRR